MKKLAECTAKPACLCCLGSLGVVLLIVGIVTAAMKVSFGGFSPIYWFVLAFACYLGIIWVVLMRILSCLEKKAESKT